MKISFFGQRNFKNDSFIKENIDRLLSEMAEHRNECVTVLWGGAQGAQTIAYDYLKTEYDTVKFKPWTTVSRKLYKEESQKGKFDNNYFFLRNIQIVDNSDLVVIFDNGEKDSEVDKVKELVEKKGIQHIIFEDKE